MTEQKDENTCYCRIHFKVADEVKTECFREKCKRWREHNVTREVKE